jgi:hypothetical protein
VVQWISCQVLPLGKTNALWNKIFGFQQLTDETIAEAWERLQDYISACPHHGMEEWFIIQSFYHGLIRSTREHIDAATRCFFFTLSIEEARKLVEKMASNQSWDEERTQTHTCKVHQLEEVDMLTTKIDLLMKKLENPGLDHLKMVDTRVMCEECEETCHMGINCAMVFQDVNFVGNSSSGFCPNQGFNARWNKPSFPFDNRQEGGMGQNFNGSEPSHKDIVRDQLWINSEVGKKLLANDRILESINSKMNNFTVVVQNQLNFNNVLETQIAQLAAALPHPNGGDFPGQPVVHIKENVKAVITRSGKTMVEPKAKPKKTSPTDPVKEEEKAEAEVEVEPRHEKEEEILGKASPKDISDTHLLPFPCQAKKLMEDEKIQLLHGSKLENVHPHFDAGCHASPNLC